MILTITDSLLERIHGVPYAHPQVPVIHEVVVIFAGEGRIIIISKPFYLFERGYKYLLQINRPSIVGTFYLNVLIKVVPGEFDELLSWPCKEKLRVTLDALRNRPLGFVTVSTEIKSVVLDFGREPCPRPLRDDHVGCRYIFQFMETELKSEVPFEIDTILITVKREKRDLRN